ncbi:ankyrin repeat domain-containing protein [Marinobacter salinisoli]|uniref:Ankyrin repeat domain-containing protein n=1 Tax=Marinobacter salinisoli TaxID=2769486 RepID=A0ABX7MTG0_9GAMM|nr:ankyrin repeat domain-containing protein [Marinobacter salinisoli]QSP94772.1 ankyrin repeat domain-containing protein [Marinobacter salinisoli]
MRKTAFFPILRLHIATLLSISIVLSGCASQKNLMKALSENDVESAREMVQAGINPFKPDEKGQSAVSLGLNAPKSSETYSWAQALVEKSTLRAKQLLAQIQEGTISVHEFSSELKAASFYVDAPADDQNNSLLIALSGVPGKTEYMSELLESHADIDLANDGGWTPLMHAVLKGNIAAAELLISSGANLEAKSRDGLTALHFTAIDSSYFNRANDTKLAQLLISAGANVNARQKDDSTPIFEAIASNRPDILQLFLEAGANPDASDEDGMTALMFAVLNGNTHAVQALISAGAYLERKNDRGQTALHIAVLPADVGDRSNDAQIVRMLIRSGANLNAHQDNKKTPLFKSIIYNRAEVRSILLESDANPDLTDANGDTPLMMAVFLTGNIEAAKALIDSGADLDATNSDGYAALHYTAASTKTGNRVNDPQLAELLIDAGANPNIKSDEVPTPLFLTFVFNRPEIRNILLKAGADPNTPGPEGSTPLMQAVVDWNEQAVNRLIAAGANLDLADKSGMTPLMRAVMSSNTEAVKALIVGGANLEATNDLGLTALHLTTIPTDIGNRTHDKQIARLLLDAGANPDARKSNFVTPLYNTIEFDRPEIRTILLAAGANPDLPGEKGATPLMRAVASSRSEAVKALLAAGANLEVKNDEGWTALHHAARKKNDGGTKHSADATIVIQLIQAGANPNTLNDQLVTPLMIAGVNNRENIVKLLLKHGARTDIKNKFGKTAEDEAAQRNHYRIVALIREHMQNVR